MRLVVSATDHDILGVVGAAMSPSTASLARSWQRPLQGLPLPQVVGWVKRPNLALRIHNSKLQLLYMVYTKYLAPVKAPNSHGQPRRDSMDARTSYLVPGLDNDSGVTAQQKEDVTRPPPRVLSTLLTFGLGRQRQSSTHSFERGIDKVNSTTVHAPYNLKLIDYNH